MYLIYLFIYTFILSLVLPIFWNSASIFFYVPFLVICFYRTKFTHALWWALICGFFVDLFSVHTRLGNTSLVYCLTTFILYRLKFRFFEDGFSTFPVLTYVFVSLSTLMLGLLYRIIDIHWLVFSWDWIQNDLIILPLKDSLFALFFYTIPLFLINQRYFSFIFHKRRRRSR